MNIFKIISNEKKLNELLSYSFKPLSKKVSVELKKNRKHCNFGIMIHS